MTGRLPRPVSLRSAALAALAGAALTALAACAAPATAPATTAPTAASAPSTSPSGSAEAATPSASPSVLVEIPAVLPGEIARAETRLVGPEGVPETRLISSDLVTAGEDVVIDGACTGGSLDWELLRAAVDDHGTTLVSGTLDCDDPRPTTFTPSWTGVVQFQARSEDVDQGWIAATPAPGR